MIPYKRVGKDPLYRIGDESDFAHFCAHLRNAEFLTSKASYQRLDVWDDTITGDRHCGLLEHDRDGDFYYLRVGVYAGEQSKRLLRLAQDYQKK